MIKGPKKASVFEVEKYEAEEFEAEPAPVSEEMQQSAGTSQDELCKEIMYPQKIFVIIFEPQSQSKIEQSFGLSRQFLRNWKVV